jgi:hypothetical protein
MDMNPNLLIRMHLAQTTHYLSQGSETVRTVTDMNPKHAANAAEKMLGDADIWADAAGVITDYPLLWMTRQPLFQALIERAGALVMA